MKKKERLVFFYDLNIIAESRTCSAPKPISVRKAFELIELVPLDQRNKEIKSGRELLYLSDWKREDDVISILVNKSDKGISDPVFTIPKEKKRRTAEKKDQEGQDFSVHILVQLPKNELDPALVLIEHCAGLGVFVVMRLLNQILNEAKMLSPHDFTQNHPDGSVDNAGNPNKYNVVFKCQFDGHISEDLRYDLNHGKIQTIELITEKEKHTNIDEDGYIKEKCKTLTLTLNDGDNPIKHRFTMIKKLFMDKKDDYSRARIKFKTLTGVNRTVEMDTDDASAQGYVKKEKLDNFESDLKSSYEKFCDAILEKMKTLLISED